MYVIITPQQAVRRECFMITTWHGRGWTVSLLSVLVERFAVIRTLELKVLAQRAEIRREDENELSRTENGDVIASEDSSLDLLWTFRGPPDQPLTMIQDLWASNC